MPENDERRPENDRQEGATTAAPKPNTRNDTRLIDTIIERLAFPISIEVAFNHGEAIAWNGREVRNPVARVLLMIVGGLIAVFGTIFAVLCAIVLVAAVVCLAPIWLPMHLILWLIGCYGFIRMNGTTLEVKFDRQAFSRR